MHSRLSKSCGAFNCASMQDTPNRSFAEQGHSLLHFALSSTLWGTVCMYDDDYFFFAQIATACEYGYCCVCFWQARARSRAHTGSHGKRWRRTDVVAAASWLALHGGLLAAPRRAVCLRPLLQLHGVRLYGIPSLSPPRHTHTEAGLKDTVLHLGLPISHI